MLIQQRRDSDAGVLLALIIYIKHIYRYFQDTSHFQSYLDFDPISHDNSSGGRGFKKGVPVRARSRRF